MQVQGQSCFEAAGEPLKAYLEGAGSQGKGLGRLFKKQGWRKAVVVAVWQTELLLASSLECEWELVELDKLRFGVEHLFRDYKSYGWQWESSQAKKLESCEGQELALAFVTMVELVLGSSQVALKAGKRSIFNLGRMRLQGYLMGSIKQRIEWEIAAFSSPVALKKLLLV